MIADFSSAGPTPLSLEHEAGRRRTGRRRHLVAARDPGGLYGRSAARAWRRRTSPVRPRCSKERHPTWTVAQIKSALDADRRSRHDGVRPESLAARDGGGVDRPAARADVPLLFAAPDRLSFGSLAPAARVPTVTLDRRRRRRRRLGGDGAAAEPARPVTVPPTVTVPGRYGDRDRGQSAGDVDGLRRPDARHGRAPHPVLVHGRRARSSAGTRRCSRRRARTRARPPARRRASRPTATRPAATSRYPGPERVTASAHRARRRTPASRPLRARGAARHVRRRPRTGSPATRRCRSTSTRTGRCSAEHVPVAASSCRPPGIYDVVFDTRSARGRRAVHVPLLGQRRDAAEAARRRRLHGGRSSSRRPTPGSGVDPSSLVATLDGAPSRRIRRRRVPHPRARRDAQARATVADYQETQEHGGRRADPPEHGDAPRDRRVR